MHHKGRRILAWLLTAAVTLGSNSVTVLAENIDPSETQALEEAVTTEENQEQDIQADIPVMEEDENGEAFDEIGGLEETQVLYSGTAQTIRFLYQRKNLCRQES